MPANPSAPLDSRRALSRQGIAITLTMVLSFTLSTAFMVWQRKAVPARATAMRAAAPAPPLPAAPAPPLPSAPLPSAPASPSPAAPTAPAPASSAAPAAGSPASPLSVHVWNRRRLGTIEGRVSNDSDRAVTVVLEGRDRDGAVSASVFFELNPREQKSFGTGTGMDLVGGGLVVARVAGYADQQVAIPP